MEKKFCSKCKLEKDICEFNTRKNRKGDLILRGYCKQCHCVMSVKYNINNPEKYKQYRVKWYSKNSKSLVEKNKKRRNSDILYKLRINIRNRLKIALKNNSIKGNTIKLLGIDIPSFKIYLESKFLNGMSWDNYGLYGWHIDHIVPLSNAKTEDDFYKLCHYTNLQPLWSLDNLKKSNKILF
jgi:hypothetical protein